MKKEYTDIPQAFRLPKMGALDAKMTVGTLDELKDLGVQNNKAYSYYRGMVVYCNEDKKRYEWTDNLDKKEKQNNEEVKNEF